MPTSTPYSAGYLAFRDGAALNSNPYGDPTIRGKAQRWAKGWKDAKQDRQQGKTRKLPR